MAALTTPEKNDLRSDLAGLVPTVTWTKSQIHAVFQAVEDWWELPATKASISAAIDSALPGLTNAQKKAAVAAYLRQRAIKER